MRKIGEILVDRVIESEGPELKASILLPDATPENLDPHRHWLEPHFLEPGTDRLVGATQSYVLRTKHHNILIDSCVGNDKPRRFYSEWNMRKSDKYMQDLAALGLTVNDIDFVMCTHLHTDHVGWNTRLVDGRWVPTFPNAKYIFNKEEWAYWEAMNAKGAKYSDNCINDSVLPVIEAGQAILVERDYGLDDQVWFEPTPGHTPGHVSIALASSGDRAIISGDVIHSPVQCAHPEWSGSGCFDKDLSHKTRRAFLERYCETDVLVMTAHFPSPSAGYVERWKDAYRFRFSPEQG